MQPRAFFLLTALTVIFSVVSSEVWLVHPDKRELCRSFRRACMIMINVN